MHSWELKAQRDAFVSSIDAYAAKYDQMLQGAKKIDGFLAGSDDTLLYKYLNESNKSIVEKITKLKSNLEKYKNATVSKVNDKIRELENEENESDDEEEE